MTESATSLAADTQPDGSHASVSRGVTAVVHPGGFVLGYEDDGRPVIVRLFRGVATRLYAELPVWIVRLLVYRSAPVGAASAIVTDDRQYWQQLADTVGSAGGRIDLYRGQPGPLPAGTPYRPLLVVDASAQYDGLRADLGPWQSVLSLQSRAVPRTVVRALRSCDGAVVHRLDQATAEAVRQAYALEPEAVDRLATLPPDSVAIAVPRRLRVAALRPTDGERRAMRMPGYETGGTDHPASQPANQPARPRTHE